MDKPTCSVDDCDEPLVARERCRMHYGRWHREERPASACSVDGCTKPALTDGKCQKHRSWQKIHGDHIPVGDGCSVDGCQKLAKSSGLCSAHYTRWIKHGSPDATVRVSSQPYRGAVCLIGDCPEPAAKRGWCQMHYRRWQRNGDPGLVKLERVPGEQPPPGTLCVVCGENPIAQGSRRFCSGRCSARAARAKHPRPLPTPTCIDCKETFQRSTRMGRSGDMRCPPCAAAHKVIRARQDARLRRARKANAPVEIFADAEIFERDGWVCGICEQPVDSARKHPDPLSPTIDHIVPLSKHGHHTRANCQLAHLTCNVRKNAKLDPARRAVA